MSPVCAEFYTELNLILSRFKKDQADLVAMLECLLSASLHVGEQCARLSKDSVGGQLDISKNSSASL